MARKEEALNISKDSAIVPEELEVLLDALPDLKKASQVSTRDAETILNRWEITAEEFSALIDENPSLRGMLFGYVAEYKFSKLWLGHKDVSYAVKPDDHNRRKKGDRVIIYKGMEFSIEVKSLQTNLVTRLEDGTWPGKAQCDGSDRRIVRFPDGKKLNTTCLLAGEFDLLAVNCHAFQCKWDFAFAKNMDLPRSTYRKYTAKQRKQLLASLVPVTWPPQPPFFEDPFRLLDEIARDRSL